MAVFTYRALDKASSLIQGTITADNERAARDLLRSRGLIVDSVAAKRGSGQRSWLPFRKRKKFAAKRVEMIRELSTLLTAGIPLLEAIDSQAKQNRGGFRTALLLVREQVAAGQTLADAFREQPDIFDTLSVQMVEVGENSGTLDKVLDQLANFSERYMQLKDRVTNALFYPLIVFLLSVGVGVFLMSVIVPMLLDNLLEAGKDIPWPTRVLKGMSDIMRTYGVHIVVTVGLGVASLLAFLKTKFGRRMWHYFLLKTPLLGVMTRKQEMARMALIVSTLLKSGLVLLHALEIAERAMKNVIIRESLSKGRTAIETGRDIGQALEATNEFPPTVVQIFAVGQQSGKLVEMLERLADTYDRQVTTLSVRLATMIEPVMIVSLALFIGFILFATVLPILEAGNVL